MYGVTGGNPHTNLATAVTSFTASAQHSRTHTFNGPFSRTTWVSRYQKGKTNLDLNEARDDGVWGIRPTFVFPSHYLPSRTVVLAIVFTV